jgi:hypothetical protein
MPPIKKVEMTRTSVVAKNLSVCPLVGRKSSQRHPQASKYSGLFFLLRGGGPYLRSLQ